MRALVWFRADLRTDDNRALAAACRDATRGVVAVFTICTKQWQQHDWADTRVEFLLRNLACLAEKLRKLNIALRIVTCPTFDRVPAALQKLATTLKCDALYANREYEVNESQRDAAVTRRFDKAGLSVHMFDDQTIIQPDAVRTGQGRFYSVFTPYKRAWAQRVHTDGGVKCDRSPRAQSEMICASDGIPESISGIDLNRGDADLWPASEAIALRRLSKFIDNRISAYKADRDLPAIDATSRLSPYLTIGAISPRRCLELACEANRGALTEGKPGPTTWISELIWREFYGHVLVGWPRVSMGRAFDEKKDGIPWRYDEEQFALWCAGRTGYPIVDAGMRQLLAEGWMHNRVRMITAMFLTKDLLIDWRWGERHFMRHLVDGDLASNNGGWQWSASTGTDAAPYFRIFNPFSQSKKFDPEGVYIRRFVPELADVPAAALHDPAKFTDGDRKNLGYAPLICDHAKARERAIAAFKK